MPIALVRSPLVLNVCAPLAAAMLIACAALAEDAKEQSEAMPEFAFGVLHDAEGVAETFAFCTPCHSEHIVAQQGLEREDWDDVFDVMEDEHGMAPIAEPMRSRILSYLSRHYGPDRPYFPE